MVTKKIIIVVMLLCTIKMWASDSNSRNGDKAVETLLGKQSRWRRTEEASDAMFNEGARSIEKKRKFVGLVTRKKDENKKRKRPEGGAIEINGIPEEEDE